MADHLEQLESAVRGRYAIEGELGTGGMATVYRARDLKHDRTVAIKVLRADLAASVGSERFLREIRIAAKLTHPHILPLHDSGEAGGLLYYVMPFVEGESLRDRLTREGQLPIDDAVRLLREVVDALGYAHKQGIVHRDIKPDNVMLTEGHALVTDFGVAKAVTEASAAQQVTSLGVAVGTPAYMAPEQAAADANVDHRADLYALGVMAYEMLTGRPPFEGRSTQTVMVAHVTAPPVPVTEHRSAIPPVLAAIVMRCLEKNPADRWQDAAALRAQLDTAAISGAVTPAGTFTTTGAAALRHSQPGRILVVFGAAAAAALGLVSLLVSRLGLPDWVFAATLGLVVAALPIALLTGRAESRRVGQRSSPWNSESRESRLSGWLSWRRMLQGGILAFGALGVVATVYMTMRLLGIGPVGTLVASGVLSERERIVLAQFESQSSDSTLGASVTELFRIDLAQSPTVTVLEPAQVAQVLARMTRDPGAPLVPELAQEVAEREGLKAIVTGEILAVGSGYVVSSRLVSTGTGQTLWAGRESASDPGGLIEAVDRLSASLRARIGESLRTIRADAPLAEVTTRSTGALRKYAQADRANDHGEFQRAIRLLEEAIADDSTFAMAYRKLAVILRNQNQEPERAKQAFTKAYELRHRLTERERYLAEAAYYTYVTEDTPASIDAYRTILEKYPTDRIALNNLAVQYGTIGRREQAAELYLGSIALGGAPTATYTNAMETLYALGRVDTAGAVLDRFESEFPKQPQVPYFRAAFAAAQFDYPAAEAAIQELQMAQRGNPIYESLAAGALASYALIRGHITEASRLMKEGYDVQAQHGLGFIAHPWEVFWPLAEATVRLRVQGDPEGALAALDRGVSSTAWRSAKPDDRMYLDYATLYAESGRPVRARAFIEEYEEQVDRAAQGKEGSLHAARAALALAEDRPDDAFREIAAFRDSVPQCPLCGLYALGEAHEIAGQLDSAAAVYEHYLTTPMLFRGSNIDNVTLVPVLRRLASVHERLGHRDQAIEYYNRFVELWSDADPVLLPLVDDARARIAVLVREKR